jgi:hypothetical protein
VAGIRIAAFRDYSGIRHPKLPRPPPNIVSLCTIMPDTSCAATQTVSTGDIESIFQELNSAEKTADAIEGRLSIVEKHISELLEKLGKEDSATQTER